jgi:hypothetical protein
MGRLQNNPSIGWVHPKSAGLNQLPNVHILRRNPTSRWVDFKTTHQLDGCNPKSA